MQAVWPVGGCVPSTSAILLKCFHKCMKNVTYKAACKYSLPDVEHKMFEKNVEAKKK